MLEYNCSFWISLSVHNTDAGIPSTVQSVKCTDSCTGLSHRSLDQSWVAA